MSQHITIDGVHFVYTTLTNKVILEDCLSDVPVLKIPEEINGYKVMKLGENFAENKNCLKEVYIPDSVITIGKSAFYACKELKKVKLSNNLKAIPERFCKLCTGLKEITIPDSVTDIYDGAFSLCYSLSNIKMSENTESVGLGAFACCNLKQFYLGPRFNTVPALFLKNNANLQSITVDESNPYFRDINGVLFSKDASELVLYPYGRLDRTYIIPRTVKTIGPDAIVNPHLETVKIYNNLKNIEVGNFPYAKDLGNTTFVCPKGSCAEEFAKKNSINIVISKSMLSEFINSDEVSDKSKEEIN